MKISEPIKKHLTILAYLLGSGICSVAIIHLGKLPEEYRLVLAGAINYIAYSLKKELDNEGIIRNAKVK